MRAPRLRISWLMALVAILALNFGAIRASSRAIPMPTMELMWLGVLPMANLLAMVALVGLLRPATREFVVGFVALGSVALAAFFAWAWKDPDAVNYYPMKVYQPIRQALSPQMSGWAMLPLLGLAVLLLTGPQALVGVIGGLMARWWRSFAPTRRPVRDESAA